MRRFRLGIDIGGTFTDFALQNVDSGELAVWKHLSSPSDPSLSAVQGAAELLEDQGVSFAEVDQIIHGTTIGTNTVIEGKGAKTALLVTDGFGDMMTIQRQLRHSPYDLVTGKHVSLVPRDLVFEVPQRSLADGSEYRPLDEGSVRGIARRLIELEVEAVAICFLHSYASADHELRTADILREIVPTVPVSLSSEVAPISREYERASTTVANAYIRPAFEQYLGRMTETLGERGFVGSIYLMQANGGVASVEVTAQLPVRALESGPAAGVIMAAAHGVRAGEPNILSFDMGGTTAKACLVEDGEPRILNSFEADQTLMRPGTGLPMLIPSVDLIEIGAGGGSLAAESLGIIEVGPESAGAAPGPVSYGLGGTQPTVTDANLVLGYMNPTFFNAGRMDLDLDKARAAIKELGDKIGVDGERAAWGIHEAVTTNMYHAMRAVTIERSRDPRQFTVIAFGGAGPIHACRLARRLGSRKVMLPVFAGVNSAVGLLYAEPRFDLLQTWVGTAGDEDFSAMEEAFGQLEQRAAGLLEATGLEGERTVLRSLDMRYHGQGNVVEVDIDGGLASGIDIADRFRKRYVELYGYADEDSMPEVTALRVSARAAVPKMDFPVGKSTGQPAVARERRPVYMPESGGFVDTPCYRRDELDIGSEVVGPAVIEDYEASAVLLPGDRCVVDVHRNLIVEIGA